MRRVGFALALALALVAGRAASAEPLAQVPGLVREAISLPFARHGGAPLALEAQVTRPAGPGRFPLLVLSHGSPRSAADRPKTSGAMYSGVAIEFARRGWAVVAVVRRGYGRSQGSYAEGSGACSNPNYVRAARTSAEDVLAAITFMGHQPYVDPRRVMLVGLSAGGFASIAAAAATPAGVVAVLNFAGGRGSDAPDSVCRPDALVEAYGELGRTVRVPTLWLYAANDHFFGPALARRFFAAFTRMGGTGGFVALPAFGSDGHLLFSRAGVPLWRAPVDAFLREHGLPTWTKPMVEAAGHLPAPPTLGASGREGFEDYLASSSFEKAFAVGGAHFGRAFGRRDAAEAAQIALENCAKFGPDCRIYAINNDRAR